MEGRDSIRTDDTDELICDANHRQRRKDKTDLSDHLDIDESVHVRQAPNRIKEYVDADDHDQHHLAPIT